MIVNRNSTQTISEQFIFKRMMIQINNASQYIKKIELTLTHVLCLERIIDLYYCAGVVRA